MRLPMPMALLASLWFATAPASVHAETYDTCKGFITALPATISTQGTWCLKADLSTALTSGNAIEIATNNVTIDCNGFKLGGLAAGDGSLTIGVHAASRQNATVRNCTIRGFYKGVLFEGGYMYGGHLVEDSRFDNNLQAGVHVEGDASTVRRNAIFDTGGATGQTYAHGLLAHNDTDVIDNTIANVTSLQDPYGIALIDSYGSVVSGNRVRGLWSVNGYYNRIGIFANNNNDAVVRDNVVILYGTTTNTTGVYCQGEGTGTHIRDNQVLGFGAVQAGCIDDGGN